MNIEAILDRIPDYQVFLTVAEMDALVRERARRYPSDVTLMEVGTSRKGHPILCTKLGNGEKNALCFACPHPNEPIGAMTLLTLADLFCGDPALLEETGFTWYLIHCIDPDGTKLNEGWFKGPFDLWHYAEHFYRPPGRQQVEWTFPIDYKSLHFNDPIPETQTLMRLIQETKPSFVFSLHNASFGGAYWYSTERDAEFCLALERAAARQAIPLQLGEPESIYGEKYSPGVHSMMSTRALVDYIEDNMGAFDASTFDCGSCSADYIKTVCDSLVLMAELPYFCNRKSEDTSPVSRTRRELLLENIRRSEQIGRFIKTQYGKIKSFLSADNPFPGLAAEHAAGFEADLALRKIRAQNPEFDANGTVSEELDNLWLSGYYLCLFIGLLRRACIYELEKAPGETARNILSEVRQSSEEELRSRVQALEDAVDYRVIPIRNLVAVQIESAFAATHFLSQKKGAGA
ncbi:MAG: hypothetical protein LBO81_06385 [Clostridiales Family XIII bacterium]|jgi:hypothetical protein|nr:hypothetical protein [Clostridiales Family XIII bacterium]